MSDDEMVIKHGDIVDSKAFFRQSTYLCEKPLQTSTSSSQKFPKMKKSSSPQHGSLKRKLNTRGTFINFSIFSSWKKLIIKAFIQILGCSRATTAYNYSCVHFLQNKLVFVAQKQPLCEGRPSAFTRVC